MRELKIGDWSARPDLNELQNGDFIAHVEPRQMDVLVYLAERAGETVSADAIIEGVWRQEETSDSALFSVISVLRKVLGDDPRNPNFIETIPKRGYRLIAPTSESEAFDDRPGGAGRFQSGTVPPDAIAAYLRGRHLWARFSPDYFERALDYFNEAIEIAPDFAPAHAGIADIWGAYGYWGMRAGAEVRDRAREAVERALAAYPDNAEANALLGSYLFHCVRDWQAAEAQFRRAQALNPNLTQARILCGLLLGTLGREEAAEEFAAAVRLDPINPAALFGRSLWLASRGDYERAQIEIKRTLDLAPSHPPTIELAADLMWTVNPDGAIEAERRIWGENKTVLTAINTCKGHAREKAQAAADALIGASNAIYVQPRMIARLLTHAGAFEDAIEHLRRAAEKNDLMQIDFLMLSPAFDPLREYPAFRELVERLGIPV